MKIPDEVLQLINDEQVRQKGEFIPAHSAYLEKLSNHAELIIHQNHEEVLGFVFFYCNAEDKKISYISLIGTSIKARGLGIGFSLLNHVLTLSKQRGFSCCQLEVRKENTQALEFYKRAGFIIMQDRGEKYLMNIQFK